jgi:hypothetical protein
MWQWARAGCSRHVAARARRARGAQSERWRGRRKPPRLLHRRPRAPCRRRINCPRPGRPPSARRWTRCGAGFKPAPRPPPCPRSSPRTRTCRSRPSPTPAPTTTLVSSASSGWTSPRLTRSWAGGGPGGAGRCGRAERVRPLGPAGHLLQPGRPLRGAELALGLSDGREGQLVRDRLDDLLAGGVVRGPPGRRDALRRRRGGRRPEQWTGNARAVVYLLTLLRARRAG